MNSKKKGSSKTSSNTSSHGKAGSGKSKPAFAFDKSSGKGRAGRSAGGREERTSGGRSGRTASGELNREEKKSISDANFKKRSTGGFADKKRNSSTAGFDKNSRPSSGPRKKSSAHFEKGPEGASSDRKRSSSDARETTSKSSGFKKEGSRSFDKKRSYDKAPSRVPKSFGRGTRKESDEREENKFDEDEFFGRKVPRTVEDEINARKRQPKKTTPKKVEEGLSKRAEKALVRRKVDKDFIDIKFNKEKEKTDSHHRELNVKKAKSKDTPAIGEGIRLNRYLSNAGVASRREADQFIQEGLVKVNGKVVTELGTKVMPGDSVKYGNKIISPEKPVYVLLNKPKDFITTTDDPQERRTVMALVANACKERIVPVGRLDRNTTGLLLFTNDGDLAQKLTHPSSNIKKIYLIELNKPIAEKDFEMIKSGKLRLFDGPVKVDDLAVTDHTRKILGIEIHEGRNRIVRRIFEELGYEVEKLDRVAYAGLTKKDLSRGKWRFLSAQEINRLKYLE
ncbi:MAG TPA: pseudouridine synthase [Cytophagaceae bacterium]|jgi:23S rRNA pseudouridine2605 synthase|nr:pseudouridine synthase [Cytophagaceae bacterium]